MPAAPRTRSGSQGPAPGRGPPPLRIARREEDHRQEHQRSGQQHRQQRVLELAWVSRPRAPPMSWKPRKSATSQSACAAAALRESGGSDAVDMAAAERSGSLPESLEWSDGSVGSLAGRGLRRERRMPWRSRPACGQAPCAKDVDRPESRCARKAPACCRRRSRSPPSEDRSAPTGDLVDASGPKARTADREAARRARPCGRAPSVRGSRHPIAARGRLAIDPSWLFALVAALPPGPRPGGSRPGALGRAVPRPAHACTSALVTRGASRDGASMTPTPPTRTSSTASCCCARPRLPAGARWTSSSGHRKTPRRHPQVAHTFAVIGNMNERSSSSASPPSEGAKSSRTPPAGSTTAA